MRFCPSCDSVNVELRKEALLEGGAPEKWLCNKCGYCDLEFPIKIEKEKVISEEGDTRMEELDLED